MNNKGPDGDSGYQFTHTYSSSFIIPPSSFPSVGGGSLGWQLVQLYESVGIRDLIEIAILAVAIYALLRLLGRTRGSGR